MNPSPLVQTSATTGTVTVDGSSAFAAQLAPTTHDGTNVIFTTVKSSGLNVSTTGAITTNGVALAANTYTVSGTDTDGLGDLGTWTSRSRSPRS